MCALAWGGGVETGECLPCLKAFRVKILKPHTGQMKGICPTPCPCLQPLNYGFGR